MKRCPTCYQVYGNTESFCETDGQRLLPDPGLTVDTRELIPDAPPSTRNSGLVATGLIGVFTGVFLCGSAYLAYSYFGSASEEEEGRPPVAMQVQEPSQTRPAPVRPDAEASPSESPTEEEEAEASPEPSQQPPTEPVSARLNQGPVSTGDQSSTAADGKMKTIIEMQDGSKVEVDAAWKDSQGVWYRQGSLVSFVEGPRVKAITARTEPKTSPAANQ